MDKQKICLITGANSGIGKAGAMALAVKGYHIIMACRSEKKGLKAQAQIIKKSGNEMVDLLLADMSSLADIQALTEQVKKKYDHLDILINNAGAMFVKKTETAEGIEATFAVNHLGPYRLSLLLEDMLMASAPSRIIHTSSGAHLFFKKPIIEDFSLVQDYKSMAAYANSKFCNLLFSNFHSKKLKDKKVSVNAFHPGFVRTNIGTNNAGLSLKLFGMLVKLFGKAPEIGADTMVWLASSGSIEGLTGGYYDKRQMGKVNKLVYDSTIQESLMEYSEKLAWTKEG